jgi:serine phosphatase RsbU (regulator of sigma subunit)/anti-sigma regulatory factor (Ser/Thr protein kinase)
MINLGGFWQRLRKRQARTVEQETGAPALRRAPSTFDVDVAPGDPLLSYFQKNPGVVDVAALPLDSPAAAALREAGVRLVVPLVSQGELIGMINLGARLSEQEYSADDRQLLDDLAAQAAPAVRVAQLARQQQQEARERERMEQELSVARLIQQTLLPQSLPDLPGYEIAAHYQPARAVGGDFYDFLYFDDGTIGIIIGDVTDKGVPAALVMATTRTLLRAAAERLSSPSAVLQRVNELLHPDIPPRMFVTCLYALLNPATGRLRFANAGHGLPYRRGAGGVTELRATGMPLGLLPDMTYDETEVTLDPGDTVLLHSDGLVEAHNPGGELFGFPRLQGLVATHDGGTALIPYLLGELDAFVGAGWEQEDDVTLVLFQRHPSPAPATAATTGDSWQSLATFRVPSEPGNERRAMEQVAAVAAGLRLPPARLERLKTAVAEAVMNAMEHGNQYQPDKPVKVEVLSGDSALAVRIHDHGGGPAVLRAETPDLEAKLAGEQTPRGWGLFLIENMVDVMNVRSDEREHVVELIMHLSPGGA